jgi:hypothetical protein
MANTADYTSVNGNMTLGLRALSMATISTVLNSCTLLAALGIMNGNKSDDIFQVGVPNSSAILSGSELSPVKQKEILECDQYNPLVRPNWQPDLKAMSIRDTNPKISTGTGATLTLTITSNAVASVAIAGSSTDFLGTIPGIRVDDATGQGAILRPVLTNGSVSSVTVVSGGYGYSTNATGTVLTNLSAGEKYTRPVFKWTHYKSTGLIYNHDIDRARALSGGSEELFHSKMNDLIMEEQKEKSSGQILRLEEDLIYGSPTTQTDNLWDAPFGITTAIDDTSIYAGVDRSLTPNAYWRAKKDATARVFSLKQLWDDAHLAKGLINNGGNIDAFFVGPTLFSKWKSEAEAYTINVNDDPMVQKLRATFGFKMPILKYMNSYVLLEPRIKPASVFGMSMAPWIVAFKKGAKFSPTKLYPQEAVEGGKDAQLFYLNTQVMVINEAPNYGQIQYTNVT